MPSTIEYLENSKVKIKIEISPEQFEKALQEAYLKNRNKINVQGFRKGKAPRKLIETQYGKKVFYEDAINDALNDAYPEAVKEHKIEVVSSPEFSIVEADKETGVVISAEAFIKPEAKIDGYVGLTYKKPSSEVTEEDVNAEIEKAREKNSRLVTITDRSIQDKDIAVIDFEGFIDDVAFEGGKGEDYELKIGSHTFIDTFEEQLVGKLIGEMIDVRVTFPEAYGNSELAGKPALFKVNIKGIKYNELPEVNDEFAQDVSEFNTLDEYKNSIREHLTEMKIESVKYDIETQIVQKLVELVEADIPEAMYDNEVDRLMRDFANRVRRQGIDIEQYYQYSGVDEETVRKSYMPNAVNNVKGRLALEAVSKLEQCTVSEDDINAELDRMSDEYKIERSRIEKLMGDKEIENLKLDLRVQKALQFVISKAISE